MSPLKQLALAGWYYGTWPYRRGSMLRAERQRQAPVSVLFYHRVADIHPNPWTISTPDFAAHIRYLNANYDLISLSAAQERIRLGENERPAVCITFDDGYAENLHFAAPLLAQERIPYTYFVTLGNVLSGEPFPHDVARRAPCPPNTVDQLQALAAEGVEIGAHTRTHADLGKVHDGETLRDEVLTAGAELSELLGTRVRYFAFPYGLPQNLSAEAISLLQQAGYAGVCTAYGDYNWPGDDAFHIKRIHADPELLRLKNWLTVDPRKRRMAREVTREVDVLFPRGAALQTNPQPCEVCA